MRLTSASLRKAFQSVGCRSKGPALFGSKILGQCNDAYYCMLFKIVRGELSNNTPIG